MAKFTLWDYKARAASGSVEISPANIQQAVPAHWPLSEGSNHDGTEVTTKDKPAKTVRLAEDFSTFKQKMIEAHGANWSALSPVAAKVP